MKLRQKEILDFITGRSESLPKGIVFPEKLKNSRASLEVYQKAYRATFFEVLGANFESLWKLMGDDAFLKLCDSFREKHLSQSYNVDDLGLDFPEFIANSPWQKDFPYLADLASLDRAVFLQFRRAQVEHRHSILSSQSTELELHAEENAFIWLESEYNIFQLWSDLSDDREIDEIKSQDQGVLVYKANALLKVMPFDVGEMYLVKALLNGLKLSEAVEICLEMEFELDHLQESLQKLQRIPGLRLLEV
ncbi:MAG: DNA-binding domain-containing protein [Bdellovibrionota bacterium]|nr:DNA-binding domain-containing protein [Bdellovibrionota bacterium]